MTLLRKSIKFHLTRHYSECYNFVAVRFLKPVIQCRISSAVFSERNFFRRETSESVKQRFFSIVVKIVLLMSLVMSLGGFKELHCLTNSCLRIFTRPKILLLLQKRPVIRKLNSSYLRDQSNHRNQNKIFLCTQRRIIQTEARSSLQLNAAYQSCRESSGRIIYPQIGLNINDLL